MRARSALPTCLTHLLQSICACACQVSLEDGVAHHEIADALRGRAWCYFKVSPTGRLAAWVMDYQSWLALLPRLTPIVALRVH